MHITEAMEVRLARMTQIQLKGLGFPLAEPWPECARDADGPLDGRSVEFIVEEDRDSFARYLEKMPAGRFAVLIPSESWHPAVGGYFRNGFTVFAVGGDVIRYQPVLADTRYGLTQAVCEAGVICELEVQYVSAWSGKPVGPAPRSRN